MSTVLTAQEPSAKYLVNLQSPLVRHFDLIAQSPGGVARLRELILTLAVQGKLVPQDPKETPVDISVIPAAINRLIGEGKVPRSRTSAEAEQETSFDDMPNGWVAVIASNVFVPRSGNSKLIKGKLFSEPAEHLYPGYSASGQDVWLSHFEYEGTAVILSAVGARCGKAFLAKGKWNAIANTHIIWPLLDLVLPEYSMILLNNEGYWIRSGGAQPFVKVTETLQQQVVLPPIAEQSRIVTRVEELMQLCDALEASGQLEAQQHAQLVNTLLGTLTRSETPEALADNWQHIATHFDLLLDRPEAVDALEQTILQLAVRGLLVPQDPTDEPASVLLQKIRTEKDHLIAQGKIKRDKSLPLITDEEKLFELPQGWEWVRLGSLGITQTGGTPASSKPEYFDGNFPFIGPGQITPNGQILSAEKFISELGTLESAVVEPGDILMVCIGGSIGKCAAATFPTAFNQQINSIHPLLSSSEYVLNAMSSNDFTQVVLSAATGSATPIISKGKWDLLLLPLPPRAEQSRIVTRANELRSLCANLRARIESVQFVQTQLSKTLVVS